MYGSGYFSISYIQPGLTWLVVTNDFFDEGGLLAGLSSTTGGNEQSYVAATTETVTSISFGYAQNDSTAPMSVQDFSAE